MEKQMLKDMLYAIGPTGNEAKASDIIRGYLAHYADSIYNDVLGNLIAFRKGSSGKKIMLSAHMDQIGLIVSDIDENGFLRVSSVGTVYPTIAVARHVVFPNGTRGVTFYETMDKTAKDATLLNMFIDIGAKTREDAEAKVHIGDSAAFVSEFSEMGNLLSCGALDDRLCCAMIAESFIHASTEHDLYAVFTVQEEVGLRGSGAAAYVIQPDLNINVDVAPIGDTPNAAPQSLACGKGPAIKVMDASVVVPQCVRNFMTACAEANGIPYQREVMRTGGTDTASIQRTRGGILAGCISIPTRYIHTPVETADINDIENGIKLINAMLASPNLPTAAK